MAFGVQSSGTSPDASSTTIVITAPTGITVGDYLTAHLTYGKSGGEPVVTPSSGFTLLKKENGESASVHAVYSKVADSGDAAATDFTFTLASSQNNRGGMLRITGQKASSPDDVNNSSFSNSNSFTVTIGTITPVSTNCLFVLSGGIVGTTEAYSGYTMVNNPPTFTEHIDVNNNPSLFVASGIRPSNSATGNINITQSVQDHSAAVVIVIKPEPTSATATPATLVGTFSIPPTVATGSSDATTVTMIGTFSIPPTIAVTSSPTWTDQTKHTGIWTDQNKS